MNNCNCGARIPEACLCVPGPHKVLWHVRLFDMRGDLYSHTTHATDLSKDMELLAARRNPKAVKATIANVRTGEAREFYVTKYA